jgi:hypothetical protein
MKYPEGQYSMDRNTHDRIFKHRLNKWHSKYEYHAYEDRIDLHTYVSVRGIIIQVLLFPFYFCVFGYSNRATLFKKYDDLFNQVEKGSCAVESVYLNKSIAARVFLSGLILK